MHICVCFYHSVVDMWHQIELQEAISDNPGGYMCPKRRLKKLGELKLST